jgi:hypothetical protein
MLGYLPIICTPGYPALGGAGKEDVMSFTCRLAVGRGTRLSP